MHAVARIITTRFNKKILAGFVLFFKYNKVKFSNIEDKPITAEEFITGDSQKYINDTDENRKVDSVEDRVLIEKAECLVHYSYVHTKNQLMV